jgi:isoaspartyl peptidase/L-asparaginase-like protein (Ntn-hydrolase superfamily)
MSDPLLLSTWSFGLRGHAHAWPALAGGGASLDAVETVCRIIDLEPDVDSVGYGGYPDASGAVTLDGSIMLAPDRCGSVCACAKHQHPVSIARRLMERTPHVLLAGPGADAFAESEGFEEADLLAEHMREKWEAWRLDPTSVDQSRDSGTRRPVDRPKDSGDGGRLFADPEGGHDTVGALALACDGVIAGACSTSGTPWKLPGRVGDSPIIGHGLYVDPRHGAATASGWGELMMGSCTSFLIVEEMRRGKSPLDALIEALRRIREDHPLELHHQVAVIAVRPDGEWASAALRPGYKTSVTDADGDRVVDPDFVLIPADG